VRVSERVHYTVLSMETNMIPIRATRAPSHRPRTSAVCNGLTFSPHLSPTIMRSYVFSSTTLAARRVNSKWYAYGVV
jgi:hypothetical protein